MTTNPPRPLAEAQAALQQPSSNASITKDNDEHRAPIKEFTDSSSGTETDAYGAPPWEEGNEFTLTFTAEAEPDTDQDHADDGWGL